jgi:hypothetical protein
MQARDAADYLNEVANKLGELGGSFVEGPDIDVDRSESRGILSALIEFPDKSRLEVAVVSPGSGSYADWLGYSFHFMDAENALIFRYDSAPHHPGGEHFPHHKHVRANERVEDHHRPSISEVVNEIRRHLYEQ